MKIEKIKGWILYHEKIYEDGKIGELSWTNVDAGYDTQEVHVNIGRQSLAQSDQFVVYVQVRDYSFGSVSHIKTQSEALAIAYSFMKRNKYIVRLK